MARRGAASAARKVLYMREYRTTDSGLELSRARHAAFKRDARAEKAPDMPRSPESVQRNVEYMRRYRSTPRALALAVVYRAKPGTLAKVAERADPERAALRRLVNLELSRGGPRAPASRSRALFAHHRFIGSG
eukprot:tig00000017_g4.t1